MEKRTRDNTIQEAVPCLKYHENSRGSQHYITFADTAWSCVIKYEGNFIQTGHNIPIHPSHTSFLNKDCDVDSTLGRPESHVRVRILIARLPLTWDYRVRHKTQSMAKKIRLQGKIIQGKMGKIRSRTATERWVHCFLGVPLSSLWVSWGSQ